ncbi:MAG: alanine--glyoxylate aminotransferase family protein [Bacteroidia bacterium]|nr:alanine--glyoxylate aminotransferase family protein [Bacteroidia bacterium]
MVSFYPGPSRVHDDVPAYVKDAYKEGILSQNHRSDAFMKMAEKTVRLLKHKLDIPQNYKIYFTSSATECWEIVAQSVVTQVSYHLFSGAFGEKWYDYTRRIRPGATAMPFDREAELNPAKLKLGRSKGVICITQNETSNGTQVSMDTLKALRKRHPSRIIAVDATSSMAGVDLDFKAADIWLASVQKCFGLPAGLGLLVCSPQALKEAFKINERNHYNSLPFLNDMMNKWQTSCTPNVLGIYLLMRVMKDTKHIGDVHKKTMQRYQLWESWLESRSNMHHLIKNKAVRSLTVLPIEATPDAIATVKSKAAKAGFLLGEGYGDLKPTTFRIANFPALKKKEIEGLMKTLS